MARAADKKRWDDLHAAQAKAVEALDAFDRQLHSKYGPYQSSWLTATQRARLEALKDRARKSGDKIIDMITSLSPRGEKWLSGVPSHWLRFELTWEDMIRPANEPLSIVVPGAWGYRDGHMNENDRHVDSFKNPTDLERFAEHISRALHVPTGFESFGENKFFVSSVYDEEFEDEMSLVEFKRMLLQGQRAGLVVMSRADLVSAMDPSLVARSEIRDPVGGEYHFINRTETRAAVRRTITPHLKEKNVMANRVRKPIKNLIEELRSNLPNYENGEGSFPHIVMRLIASLPGGDELEDLGYEPLGDSSSINWREAEILAQILTTVQNTNDVEALVEGLTEEDEED